MFLVLPDTFNSISWQLKLWAWICSFWGWTPRAGQKTLRLKGCLSFKPWAISILISWLHVMRWDLLNNSKLISDERKHALSDADAVTGWTLNRSCWLSWNGFMQRWLMVFTACVAELSCRASASCPKGVDKIQWQLRWVVWGIACRIKRCTNTLKLFQAIPTGNIPTWTLLCCCWVRLLATQNQLQYFSNQSF